MRNLIVIAIVLGLAVVLILTKPTPKEMASAATGQMNYVIINKDKMPREFVAVAAAAAVLRTVEDIVPGTPVSGLGYTGISWRTGDFIFLKSSELRLINFGSLKCVWLLRSGLCIYFSE
jgi:hypothetical protein